MSHDSIHALWVDPLTFDPLTNGAPYFPEKSQMRLASEVRDDIFSSLCERFPNSTMGELGALLVVLRAAAHVHQTHHWQTAGGHFYGDHLLFMRLYEDSQPFIDQVAERAVGAGDRSLVDPKTQVSLMDTLVHIWCGEMSGVSLEATAEDMVRISGLVEDCVVQCIAEAKGRLEAKGNLSEGTDNLLQGVSDKHEEFLYLLKQRTQAKTLVAYDYDRR